MLLTRRKRFIQRATFYTLCALVAHAITGCGLQSAPILGATVEDGENGPDGDSLDQISGTDQDAASPSDVPDNAYCEPVSNWDAAWIAFENEVLELVNERRAAGADCGSTGTFDPAGPLTMDSALRCAARNHSMDMATEDYFDHYTPEGIGPGDRLDEAGYTGSMWGENIAWGYLSPEAVVSGWMSSPGHCSNIMQARFTEIGVGYYAGSLWTQTFGRP
jgi:uncharacterized protein YkwD